MQMGRRLIQPAEALFKRICLHLLAQTVKVEHQERDCWPRILDGLEANTRAEVPICARARLLAQTRERRRGKQNMQNFPKISDFGRKYTPYDLPPTVVQEGVWLDRADRS